MTDQIARDYLRTLSWTDAQIEAGKRTKPAAAAPMRIQQRRTRGWRMPPGSRSVARPTRFGNPFTAAARLEFPYRDLGDGLGGDVVRDLPHAVALFAVHAHISSGFQPWIRYRLAGLNLACWCGLDQPCHADILLRIANTQGTVPLDDLLHIARHHKEGHIPHDDRA